MHIVRSGAGPLLVFVHGSAADADSWSIQRRRLAQEFTVLAYDRNGAPRSPLPPGVSAYAVEQHADDLEALLTRPAVVVGSSFGAVCTLELARRQPAMLRGIVLCEPPLPPRDGAPSVGDLFLTELHRRNQEQGGRAAAEFFLRRVLGDAFLKLPGMMRERCLGLHRQILLDADALHAYAPRYEELAQLEVPALLLGGGCSGPEFAPTLAALAAALPQARRHTLSGGSHMMHADAFAEFNEVVASFAATNMA